MTRKGSESTTIDFDIKVIQSVYNMPIEQAAKHLGVCVTVLKRICRRKGIPRWPYRKLKSINKMIASIEEYSVEGEHVSSHLAKLKIMRDAILNSPNNKTEEETNLSNLSNVPNVSSISKNQTSSPSLFSFNDRNESNIGLSPIITTSHSIPQKSLKFVSSRYENRNPSSCPPSFFIPPIQKVNKITHHHVGNINENTLNTKQSNVVSQFTETFNPYPFVSSPPNISPLPLSSSPSIHNTIPTNINFVVNSNNQQITSTLQTPSPPSTTTLCPPNSQSNILPSFSDFLKQTAIGRNKY